MRRILCGVNGAKKQYMKIENGIIHENRGYLIFLMYAVKYISKNKIRDISNCFAEFNEMGRRFHFELCTHVHVIFHIQ